MQTSKYYNYAGVNDTIWNLFITETLLVSELFVTGKL